MLEEIRGLGFEYAELSHGIRLSLLPGILEAVSEGVIRISTLHNFCPLPIGVSHAAPNLFKFSALDSRERENAFRYTLKTFETAERLEASLVVLHLGAIEMKNYTDRLVDLIEAGRKDSSKFEKLSQEVLERRERKKEKPVEFIKDMLRRLEPEAAQRGLKLGIENRQALEELPLESDMGLLFRELNSPTFRYWHDCGHAQIKENLGFIYHRMHIESLADRLAGFHIHDVEFPARDHCAPGSGMIDFAALKNLVKPEHIKVFELCPGLPEEEVRQGVAHIREVWGDQ